VATIAESRQRSVVSAGAGVALDALHGQMEPGQRERRGGVIES
jgi:hypothetical protein